MSRETEKELSEFAKVVKFLLGLADRYTHIFLFLPDEVTINTKHTIASLKFRDSERLKLFIKTLALRTHNTVNPLLVKISSIDDVIVIFDPEHQILYRCFIE